MSTTITIRAEASLRTALERRAAERGTTLSSLVREILESAVLERPVSARAAHLEGRLALPTEIGEPRRRRIRERNWRP
jgi:hypothetical protein